MKTRNQTVKLYSLPKAIPKARRNENLNGNEGGEIFNAFYYVTVFRTLFCYSFHAFIMINL